MITIIIPTMWKSPLLLDFLPKLCDNQNIQEIIIIDNDYKNNPASNVLRHEKIKIVCFGKNIFVNPAWNYGVSESQTDMVCLMNDDITYDTTLFDKVIRWWDINPDTGSIGFSPGVTHLGQKAHVSHDINFIEPVAGQDLLGYGCLIFTKKSLWREIPRQLKIYAGDAFIFDRTIWTGKKNYLITDIQHQVQYATTCNSVTDGGKKLSEAYLQKEIALYEQIKNNRHLYLSPSETTQDIIFSKQYDNIFFSGAMSLGDAFVMNAIVHDYASKSNTLVYPCKPEYLKTLQSLYQDYDNIQVVAFENTQQEHEYIIKNGLSKIDSPPIQVTTLHRHGCEPENIHIHWPQQIYENFDIVFSKRYRDFRMPKIVPGSQELYEAMTNGRPYILVHRYTGDHPNGIPINVDGFRKSVGLPDLDIIEIREGQTDNMLQYKTLIENAAEVHCVPSSFFCLVDSMQLPATCTPYFHDIRRNSLMKVNSRWNDYKWRLVNYSVRL